VRATPEVSKVLRIFLSYRRDDAPEHAQRLRADLAHLFDIRNPPLAEFVADVDQADVAIAVIGPRWAERDARGSREIDDPNDQVRLELVAAIARRITIYRVFVAGASRAELGDLPPALKAFHLRGPRRVEIADEAWRDGIAAVVAQLGFGPRSEVERSTGAVVVAGSDPGRSLHEPGYRPEIEGTAPARPSRVNRMLQEAAHAGVVPNRPPAATSVEVGSSIGVAGGDEPPPDEPEQIVLAPPQEPVPAVVVPPPADDRTFQLPVPDRRPSPLGRLLWIGLPFAVLGGGALVVAKWLLGWFVPNIEADPPSSDTVVCTVFAPAVAAPGSQILVQAFAHLPEDAADAQAIAMEMDTDARRRMYQSLWAPVPNGSRLDFELQMPGLTIDNPVQSLTWNRRPEPVPFGVTIPNETQPGALIGTLHVSLNAAPLGCIKFKLQIDPRAALISVDTEPQGDRAQPYRVAFISYASKDRDEVLERVQMLTAVGIRYFQDVLSLEPGERWAQRLEAGIDDCDLFILFWSSRAKQSEWVRKEVDYALKRKAGDDLLPPEIRPVLLLEKPIAEPWEELAHLHFNDRLLYFMSPGGGA
jgi:TIR domain-containing protein